MHYYFIAIGLALALTAQTALSQPTEPITSESRDAATAYVGVTNFIVGRIARDCLSVLNRSDSPQQFVDVWQQKNIKYLTASAKYMEIRLNEALESGGVDKRDAILGELTTVVRRDGETTVKSWLAHENKEQACNRAIALVEAGGLDISSTSPIFGEIEALVAWAQQ